jgi:hypothetical protein
MLNVLASVRPNGFAEVNESPPASGGFAEENEEIKFYVQIP